MVGWLRRHRLDVLLFIAATLWFLPALWWGLPTNGPNGRMRSWAPDELGPWGAINTFLTLTGDPEGHLGLQYPLGHFLVQGILVWPYHLFVTAADNIGMAQRRESLEVLGLLHRIPSVVLSAGTVVIARQLGRRLHTEPSGWFAAVAVATIGPLVYYARTSNVDASALFWIALGVLIAIRAVRNGLTTRRAIALGLTTAMATATNDQQYPFSTGLWLVVLASHLLDRRATGDWRGWWRAPAVGIGAGAAAYVILSGVLLLPSWFRDHVAFMLGTGKETSDQFRTLPGSDPANPATIAGYGRVAWESWLQVLAAIGLPTVLLGVAGLRYWARRNWRMLALFIIPAVCFALGVLAPVRFVRPRFLLPVEFLACVLAGVTFGGADHVRLADPGRRLRNRAIQVAVRVVGILGLLWTTVRAVDLTTQMLRDGRYEAAEWLAPNIQRGDTVAFFGAAPKLPRLPAETVTSPAPGQLEYRESVLTSMPKLIVSVPQHPIEPVHEWSVPDSTFERLLDGSAGYTEVLAIQGPGLWPRPLRVASYVNPPVRVFARTDVIPTLRAPPRIELDRPSNEAAPSR